MAKRGPKRRRGPREPNGRLQRPRKRYVSEEPAVLGYTLVRRGSAWLGEDKARQPEAGYALGRLWLYGVITRRQHDAGLKFGDAWRRWKALAGIAPHVLTTREPGIPRPDPSEKEWRRVKERFYRMAAELRKVRDHTIVWRLLEMLALEDQWPLQWRDHLPFSPLVSQRLGGALEVLADWFGLATK